MSASLSLRLFLAAAVSTMIALMATALVLTALFRSYFEERIHAEIGAHLVQLAGNVKLDASGQVLVSELPDPRFSEPLSGYYWQVEAAGQEPVLSQSYWFQALTPEWPARRGEIEFIELAPREGPGFIAGSWLITREYDGAMVELHLLVALEKAQLESSVAGFTRNLAISMGVLGVFLVLASFFQVSIGLRPLDRLRAEVARVKDDPGHRLSRDLPTELEPLVAEVNELLDHQSHMIETARTHASTLAHGLKTPLTVMRALSQELRGRGADTIPDDIDEQVETMQHQVERELARTRDQLADRDVWCRIGPVADKVIHAFRRQAGNGRIRWHTDIAADALGPFDEFALTELLGNLVDNAAKWTRDEITISAVGRKEGGHIQVADNGPGMAEGNLSEVLERGRRLDDTKPGQGLGLAIVNDMATQRGAVFRLRNRASGGLVSDVSWGDDRDEAQSQA